LSRLGGESKRCDEIDLCCGLFEANENENGNENENENGNEKEKIEVSMDTFIESSIP
jgi:hypothetical protein